MLYLYYGDNLFDLKKEVTAWKDKFISKFGDFNLVHIKEVLEHDNNFLHENLLATSFMADKKLVIIDDVPSSSDRKDLSEKEAFLLSIIDDIPDDNIVLFVSVSPDKRGKLFKELSKKATVKEFALKKGGDLKNDLKVKFGSKISDAALDTLCLMKADNYNKIAMEIEKLSISIPYIEVEDVRKNVLPELEESVFEIANDILNRDKLGALNKVELVLNETNMYAVYNAVLSSLRTTYYIFLMKSLKLSQNEIVDRLGLGRRGFLVNKNYKIKPRELRDLYFALVDIDTLMKTGALLDSDDKALKFEFEKIILTK